MCCMGVPRPSLRQFLTTWADVRAEFAFHGLGPEIFARIAPETIDYWINEYKTPAEIYAICVNRPTQES